MRVPYRSVLTAVSTVVAFASFCVVGSLGQANPHNKTDVLRIGVVLPFGIPGVPIEAWSPLGALATQCYNAMLWYAEKINNQTEILPNVRIQIVVANSMYDRGVTLTAAQSLSTQGIFAMAGEAISRNTVTASLVSSVNRILHCNALATTTTLSNKQDFPFAFRTLPTIANAASALLAVVRSQGVNTVSVMASDDEAGSVMVQELSAQSKTKNVTIRNFVQFAVGQRSYVNEFSSLIAGKAQTILIIASMSDGPRLMNSARNLSMFSGDYWLISSTGWDAHQFVTAEDKITRREMAGVWQVYPRLAPQVGEWGEFAKWWFSHFNNEQLRVNATGMNCDLSIPFARGCMGSGIVGSMPEYIRALGARQPLTLQFWASSSFACTKLVADTVDFYLKSGNITFADITNRRLLSTVANGNVSQLFNRANIPDFWNKTWTFDKGGDAIMDMAVINYKWDDIENSTWFKEVGFWDIRKDEVTYTEPVIFLGNRTSPPQPPPTPTVQFQANMTLRYALDGVVALCSFTSLALAAAMIFNLKQKIFKAASPLFLALILGGANISFISIWLFSQYPMTNSSCVVYGWLKYLGFAVVFGSLIVKTYRIYVIFASKRRGKQKLSDLIMLAYFLILIALWVMLLLVWTLVPSQRPMLDFDRRFKIDETGSVSSVEETPRCNFGTFNFICLAAMVLTLALGVFLTYSVRATPGAFNESKWMAYAIYNWVVIGIVLNAIANFAVSNPDIIFVMEALTVIITQTGVCVLMIAPKLLAISRGAGDEVDTFQSETSSSSKKNASARGLSSAVESKMTTTINEAKDKEVEMLRKKLQENERELEAMKKELEALRGK